MNRARLRRLGGLADLVLDAVEGGASLVERELDAAAGRLLDPLRADPSVADQAAIVDGVRRVSNGVTFGAIRLAATALRAASGAAIAIADRAADEGDPVHASPAGPTLADAALGALNGFAGHHLAARENPLALRMVLRANGRDLALDAASLARDLPVPARKLAVFVHGLACTEQSWSLFAERFHGRPDASFGSHLERDLGHAPVYVRYNSGLHVSENGRALAALLEQLVLAHPGPIDEIALVGHSMGGLVARSAAHYAADGGLAWPEKLRHVVCLGSPHLGAPLEKAANVAAHVLGAVDALGARIPGEVLRARSDGIKDLRFGYVLDDDWRDRDPDALLEDRRGEVPFVEGASYAFVASTLTKDPAHPLGALVGDLLVRPASARGHAPEPARRVRFDLGHVVGGVQHIELVSHPAVYEALRGFLAGERAPADR